MKSLWQSLLTTLFFGFIVPCCWSKYGELVPAPIIISIFNFNLSCIDKHIQKIPLYLSGWTAFFYVFVYTLNWLKRR